MFCLFLWSLASLENLLLIISKKKNKKLLDKDSLETKSAALSILELGAMWRDHLMGSIAGCPF